MIIKVVNKKSSTSLLCIYYLIEIGEHRYQIYGMIVPSEGIVLGA